MLTLKVPRLTLRSPDIPSEVAHLIVRHMLLDALCSIGLLRACQGSVAESMLGHVGERLSYSSLRKQRYYTYTRLTVSVHY